MEVMRGLKGKKSIKDLKTTNAKRRMLDGTEEVEIYKKVYVKRERGKSQTSAFVMRAKAR